MNINPLQILVESNENLNNLLLKFYVAIAKINFLVALLSKCKVEYYKTKLCTESIVLRHFLTIAVYTFPCFRKKTNKNAFT